MSITVKRAYQMGYRHVCDLAEINQVALQVRECDDTDGTAKALMNAWREGAMAAKAMLDKEGATVH